MSNELCNELVDVNIISNNETGVIEISENKIKLDITDRITPYIYMKDKNCLNYLKIPEIKELLKFYKKSMILPCNNNHQLRQAKNSIKKMHDFGLIGNKKILKDRLMKYFSQEILAINIQKCMRGYFVRKSLNLIGPAIRKREICLNDSDFSTLEPLKNININDFFSYKDHKGYVYGFQLSSLIEYIKKRKHKEIKNPYNRSSMNYLLKDISQLNRLHKIISHKFVPSKRQIITMIPKPRRIRNMDTPTSRYHNMLSDYNYNHSEMLIKIREIRSKTIIERTNSLFMEIDNLGNYSNSRWFSDLDRRGYIRFFRILKDIWIYRAQIPSYIKIKISPLWDPFLMLSTTDLNEYSIDELQCLCLSVMEDLIYTGVDTEYKTLGALHVLSVLTVVSYPAREAMPWLYESLV